MANRIITYEVADHVALVTMDNLPVNAQDRRFHEQMAEVMDELGDREEVRAVVLTGAGKCFSAGADIKSQAGMEYGPGERSGHSRRVRECFHAIAECKAPVVAAINGPALGAGLTVAASCDLLVASEDAVIGLPEIDVGLLGGGRHAMRLFGHSLARRMMLTGYRVPGPELYRLGVVEACVPAVDLLATAMGLAAEIASKSPVATRLAKHALNTIEEMSLRDGYRFEQEMTAELSKSEDSKEAKLAFVEKRKPIFKGK